MVSVVTESTWVPWYRRHAPPAFCFPCLPAYMGIWKARKPVFVLGFILFAIGAMLLFGALLTCIALECGGIASGLGPLGLVLMIVGLLLIHCGWAAHLLDNNGQIPIKKTVVTTTTTTYNDDEEDDLEKQVFEKAYKEPLPNIKQGFWQFDEKESWQAAANPYPIQHTLKYCLDRPAY